VISLRTAQAFVAHFVVTRNWKMRKLSDIPKVNLVEWRQDKFHTAIFVISADRGRFIGDVY
jgi:hypothetical protein